ncbi:TRAP transporter large permease subunit [Chloroflexota bacterium]
MVRVLRAANWGLDRILDGTGFLGIALMITLSLFVSLVMMSRHVLALNIPHFFDASMYVLIIFPLTTAAYTLRAEKHIVIDVFVSRLSERAQAALRIIAYLAVLIFVFVFAWQGIKWWLTLFSTGLLTFGVWQVPQWILVGLIIFGVLLLIPMIIRIVAKDYRVFVSDKASGTISQGFLFIAIFIIGFAGAIYLFIQGSNVAAILLLLAVVLFAGVPVFLALGIMGTVGLYFALGLGGLVQIPHHLFGKLNSFPLTCLPLFVFAGMVMERGKLVDDLFKFVEVWVGHFTPAIPVVTIIVGMLICSLTGSPTAATAMLAATALPVLINRGYKKSLGAGLIAGSGAGALIPPSIGYVVYCVLVEESIAELFIASIIPAIILFGLMIVYILVLNVFNKKALFEGGVIPPRSTERVSWRQKFVVTGRVIPTLFAPVLVMGTIYTGIFTPTESAAALLVYSIILTVLFKRTLNLRGLYQACSQGTVTSSMILSIIAVAFIFAAAISQLGVVTAIQDFGNALGLGAIGVLSFMFLALLILGMVMNAGSIKVITLPIFYPMAMAVGINPIWLGVFYEINNELGSLTPPFGMDFFVIKSVVGLPYGTVLKGVLPFILLYVLTMAIITVFPETALWLPSTMK